MAYSDCGIVVGLWEVAFGKELGNWVWCSCGKCGGKGEVEVLRGDG